MAAWRLYFGVLGDPGTILGRFSYDPETLAGTRKGPGRSRPGFYQFFDYLGDQFCQFFEYFWNKKQYFIISISRLLFLMIFGCEFECPGLQKQAFGIKDIEKMYFRRSWISDDSSVDVS